MRRKEGSMIYHAIGRKWDRKVWGPFTLVKKICTGKTFASTGVRTYELWIRVWKGGGGGRGSLHHALCIVATDFRYKAYVMLWSSLQTPNIATNYVAWQVVEVPFRVTSLCSWTTIMKLVSCDLSLHGLVTFGATSFSRLQVSRLLLWSQLQAKYHHFITFSSCHVQAKKWQVLVKQKNCWYSNLIPLSFEVIVATTWPPPSFKMFSILVRSRIRPWRSSPSATRRWCRRSHPMTWQKFVFLQSCRCVKYCFKVKMGGGVAQRKHSCFHPAALVSNPGSTEIFSLLLSLWTVLRSSPPSAKQRISQIQLAVTSTAEYFKKF